MSVYGAALLGGFKLVAGLILAVYPVRLKRKKLNTEIAEKIPVGVCVFGLGGRAKASPYKTKMDFLYACVGKSV